MHVTKSVQENAEVMLSGTLVKKDIEVFWDNAVRHAQKEVVIPGFRKGFVPEAKLIEEVGADFLWKEAAEMALKDALEGVLKEHEVTPITPLNLSLKKAEKGADVLFEIVAVTLPTCNAGDYKVAAQKAIDALPADDVEKEKADAVQAFRMQVRAISMMKNPESIAEGEAKANEEKVDTPLTDDEAKLAGFENSKAIEHFIDTEAEKAVKDRSLQKKRGAVAEAVIAEAKADIPLFIVEEETKALFEMFKRDVVAQGMEWSEYLKRVKKDEAAVLVDLKPQARKRVTLDLAFADIAKKENVTLEEGDKTKEDEVAHALSHQGVPHEDAHRYAREQLLREKIWKVLGAKSESAV